MLAVGTACSQTFLSLQAYTSLFRSDPNMVLRVHTSHLRMWIQEDKVQNSVLSSTPFQPMRMSLRNPNKNSTAVNKKTSMEIGKEYINAELTDLGHKHKPAI